MRPVLVPELVHTLCNIMDNADSEINRCTQSGACESWTSECGEIIIERRETAHSEMRFFMQDPDDFYTEYRLSYRNYLVFAYRDWVWSNFSSPSHRCTASEQEIPEACWQILTEQCQAFEAAQTQPPEPGAADGNQRNNRHVLANLLRAS